MNLQKLCSAAILGSTLLLAGSALAADKEPLKIFDPVNAAGKQIQPGDYTLQWEGNGPTVDVNIMRGKTVVATIPARVVENAKVSTGNGTTTTANDDGSRSISEIHFRGKKFALEIGGPETASAHDAK